MLTFSHRGVTPALAHLAAQAGQLLAVAIRERLATDESNHAVISPAIQIRSKSKSIPMPDK